MSHEKSRLETSHISTVVGDCHLAVWLGTGPLLRRVPKVKHVRMGIEATHHVTVTDGQRHHPYRPHVALALP